MTKSTMALSAVMAALALTACSKKKEEGAAPATSASTTNATATANATGGEPAPAPKAGDQGAAAAGGDAAKCSALGCKSGDGSFFKMCDCKGKPQEVPFEAKYTGKYQSFSKQPEWEVTNKTDKEIHWASANVYYYDKSGKQLEATVKDKAFKSYRVNGSTFSLKPKETKKLSIGFKQENAPANAASLEVVFDGWCFGNYADKSTHLCMRVENSPDERARAGK